MEKINRRLLNYKYYSKFLQDRTNGKIPNDSDAIVFIQDVCRIWARGKEYVCTGSGNSYIDGKDLKFVDGLNKVIFTLNFNGNDITITDSKGNTITNSYALKSDLSLKLNVLYAGNNISIKNDVINCDINVDSDLSESSTNPVLNKAIHKELRAKQKILRSGDGINIEDYIYDPSQAVISSTLDVNVYVIVQRLPDASENPNPNKIYVLEHDDGHGNITYTQHRYRGNGIWAYISPMSPSIDLLDYLKKGQADLYYQFKGNYLVLSDLNGYVTTSDLIPINNTISTKANKKYVDDNFVDWPSVWDTKLSNILSNPITDNIIETTPYVPVGTVWTFGDKFPAKFYIEPALYITGQDIVVDNFISSTSRNPVQNRAIYRYLRDNFATKEDILDFVVDISIDNSLDITSDNAVKNSAIALKFLEFQNAYATKNYVLDLVRGLNLSQYAKDVDVQEQLSTKLKVLRAGYGIRIIDEEEFSEISTILDTTVFIIVSDLTEITDPNPNKIYLLETLQNGQYQYEEYRFDAERGWISHGYRQPDIQLESYATIDYVDGKELSILTLVSNTYTRKDSIYSPQQDDSISNNVTENTTTNPDINPGTGGINYGNITVDTELSSSSYNPIANKTVTDALNQIPKFVTISELRYQILIELDAVDPNTYYFIYEGNDGETWTFGQPFPIIFSEQWGFGQPFPIILT